MADRPVQRATQSESAKAVLALLVAEPKRSRTIQWLPYEEPQRAQRFEVIVVDTGEVEHSVVVREDGSLSLVAGPLRVAAEAVEHDDGRGWYVAWMEEAYPHRRGAQGASLKREAAEQMACAFREGSELPVRLEQADRMAQC